MTTFGVASFFSVPNPAELEHSDTVPTPLANPYSGSGSLTPTGGGKEAYGLHWIVSANPTGAGKSTRAVVVFEENWLSLAMQHELADLTTYIGERVLTGDSEGWVLFRDGIPTAVLFDLEPGWAASFDWLVLP